MSVKIISLLRKMEISGMAYNAYRLYVIYFHVLHVVYACYSDGYT